MKNTSLTPRSVDAIGLSFCAAIVAAFYFLAAAPLLSRQSDARDAAESVKDENDRIVRLSASLRQTRIAVAATTDKLNRFGSSLRRADSVNDRISSLVELAKSLGLQLTESTPGAPRSGNEFDAIPVRLGGRGTLTGIASFLDSLHAKQSDVAIESLDIRGGSAGARQGTTPIEFSLLLTSYVEHAPSAAHTTPADPAGSAAGTTSTTTNTEETP